ncbi:MAG: hypothetical protein JWL84_116 [Rhodospirillales bacterium]|nr:hypothetical protein [Rhodospirillales bacterium]
MIIDSLLLFDPSGTALTASAASTNVLDTVGTGIPASPQGNDLGIGPQLKARICIQTALLASGAATLQIQLQAAPDNAGAPGTYITISQSDAIPKASLVAGAFIDLEVNPLPPQGMTSPPTEAPANIPRFYRLNYVVATGPFTAGTIEAFLTDQVLSDNQVGYQRNFVVV